MANTHADDVVARALEEVAKSRALRERMARDRERSFAKIPGRQSIYVLARRKPPVEDREKH